MTGHSGKSVPVTAAQGIGRAAVKELAAVGARVIAIDGGCTV